MRVGQSFGFAQSTLDVALSCVLHLARCNHETSVSFVLAVLCPQLDSAHDACCLLCGSLIWRPWVDASPLLFFSCCAFVDGSAIPQFICSWSGVRAPNGPIMGQRIAALKRVRDSSLLSCFEFAVGYVAVEILADAIKTPCGCKSCFFCVDQ